MFYIYGALGILWSGRFLDNQRVSTLSVISKKLSYPKESRMVTLFWKFTSWERQHLERRVELHWTWFGTNARQSKSKSERNSMGKNLDVSTVYCCCLDWVFRLYNWFCYNGYDASIFEVCSVLASEYLILWIIVLANYSYQKGFWSVVRWAAEFSSNFIKLHTCRHCFNRNRLLY